MVHPHLERLRRMLSTSEIQRREVEAKLADAEAKLEESKLAIWLPWRGTVYTVP